MAKLQDDDWWHDEEFVSRLVRARDQAATHVSDYLQEIGHPKNTKLGRLVAGVSPWSLPDARSPIEELFYVALYPHAFLNDVHVEHEPEGFGNYRPDFVLSRATPSTDDNNNPDFHWIEELLIVELDGHEFHEKTREQAEHDKRRDRWFAAQGHRVIRFTGREAWRDPSACVTESLAFFPPLEDTTRDPQ